MEIKLSRKSDEGYERFELLGDITANVAHSAALDPMGRSAEWRQSYLEMMPMPFVPA